MGCRACLASSGGDSSVAWAALTLCSLVVLLRFRSAYREVWPTDGRCVTCRYDLAGLGASGLCPECGGSFPRARRVRRHTEVVLSRQRVVPVLIGWALAVLAVNLPLVTASNGVPLALPDVAWSLAEWWRGADAEVLDRMLRNRARARSRDPSARSTLLWIIAPSVLWALVPGRGRRIGLIVGHIALGVGWTLGLALSMLR